jgi:HKD family nuclease
LAFYARHGIGVRAILTDNAWSYTQNRALRELLSREGVEHRTIPPPISRVHNLCGQDS